jgi:hypothetical protein
VKKLVALASVLVLGGSLGVAALFAGSAPSFAAARSYATGRAPASVAAGELNGDGKPDLATANFGAHTVSVLLNRGDGSFQARRDYWTGGRPFSVAIGDLNGDGKPDLAIANGDAVAVLLNRGDGSFQAKLDYVTGPAIAVSVAIGDLNGDGKPDLVTANGCCPSTVSVLLNRGDGRFQPNLDYRTDLGPASVAIGDLSGDGTPDLVTANELGYSVSVLLNRGDGSFQPKRDYEDGSRPRSVAVGDLNGDRKLDLATANWDTDSAHNDIASASVFLNRGDGSFRAIRNYGTEGEPQSVTIRDLNGDGKADVATANAAAKTVSVLLNTPGLCTVQDVKRQRLPAAKRTIARANCRVGKIRRAYSNRVKKGRMISETPKPGTVLPNRGKVSLVVSRGRRPA